MKPTKVICHHCHGSGRIALSGVMQATLDVLTRDPQPTQEVARKLGDQFVKASAINNRLAHIQSLGLASSEKRGKVLYWRKSK